MRKKQRLGPIINSIKNHVSVSGAISGTLVEHNIAKAVNTPLSTSATEVSNGCIIKAIWVSLDVCGLAGAGVANSFSAFIMKNPGDNLTEPLPFSVGGSNEKKFIFKMWQAMIMRIQDGPNPYHWEGWIKIPKRYQRMGTDDILTLTIACTAAVTGLMSAMFIYKWYR